jgi:hypothetical protein
MIRFLPQIHSQEVLLTGDGKKNWVQKETLDLFRFCQRKPHKGGIQFYDYLLP